MKIILIVLGGWIASVCLHEFAHALVAYWGGDKTVRDKGYLTLNPLRYTHPLLSIGIPIVFLLLGGIGLPGGAVYIRDDLLRGKTWRAAVSLAGPLMNALLALLLAVPFLAGWWGPLDHDTTVLSVAVLAFLQVTALLLNLIPVPPLDGFGFLSAWFPRSVRDGLNRFAFVGLVGLYVVLFRVPAATSAFWKTVYQVTTRLGIGRLQITLGLSAFQNALRSLLS